MTTISLPLLPNQYVIGYPPKDGNTAEPVQYFALTDILTRAWTTDAHLTAYSVPNLPYRLSKGAVQLDGGVVMALFAADVDCEQSHTASGGNGEAPAPDAWWLGELEKLDRLLKAFPGAFIYRTRGGYRILYFLPAPWVLTSPDAVASWRAAYLAWIAALRVRFNIYADTACHDWQRLYRVPHATRSPGGRPEARETLGNPYQVGTWTCEPTAGERTLATTLAKKSLTRSPRIHQAEEVTSVDAGDGILFHAFRARGWLGEAINSGKWSVQCPWDDQHTKGTPYNTSTVLFAPGAGETLGWLHCSHGHCQQRDIRDVLKMFSPSALEAAANACGLPRRPTWQGSPLRRVPSQSWRRLPLMTVKEVDVCQL